MNQLYLKERTKQSLTKITKILNADYSYLAFNNIEPFANGVENLVFKATSSDFGTVVIKTQLEQFVNNDNDGLFHARRLLKKEIDLTQHVSKHGIPVPAIQLAHFSEEMDFIICEFIA
jgi:hypothetical protein